MVDTYAVLQVLIKTLPEAEAEHLTRNPKAALEHPRILAQLARICVEDINVELERYEETGNLPQLRRIYRLVREAGAFMGADDDDTEDTCSRCGCLIIADPKGDADSAWTHLLNNGETFFSCSMARWSLTHEEDPSIPKRWKAKR